MDTLLTAQSISISELRESPARAFEQAGDSAVVVLNRNRPAGYIVSPRLMEAMLDQLADHAVANKVEARLSSLRSARKITLDEL